MPYQIRDYRITPGAMSDWLDEWGAQILPLRTRLGFEVISAWSNPETNRFVWIIAHDGDFEEADRAYYESPERLGLSPNPARFIEENRSEFVSRVG